MAYITAVDASKPPHRAGLTSFQLKLTPAQSIKIACGWVVHLI